MDPVEWDAISWYRDMRYPHVFRVLTCCQGTPRFWGITLVMSQNNLGNTKARFGNRKVLGKGKKIQRKIIFPFTMKNIKEKQI